MTAADIIASIDSRIVQLEGELDALRGARDLLDPPIRTPEGVRAKINKADRKKTKTKKADRPPRVTAESLRDWVVTRGGEPFKTVDVMEAFDCSRSWASRHLTVLIEQKIVTQMDRRLGLYRYQAPNGSGTGPKPPVAARAAGVLPVPGTGRRARTTRRKTERVRGRATA